MDRDHDFGRRQHLRDCEHEREGRAIRLLERGSKILRALFFLTMLIAGAYALVTLAAIAR